MKLAVSIAHVYDHGSLVHSVSQRSGVPVEILVDQKLGHLLVCKKDFLNYTDGQPRIDRVREVVKSSLVGEHEIYVDPEGDGKFITRDEYIVVLEKMFNLLSAPRP